MSSPGGRARNREGEGGTTRCKPMDRAGCSGGVVSDGTTTRTHRATGEALLVPTRKGGSWVGRITGSTGKSADDERVAEGFVVALKRRNGRGAKEPYCSYSSDYMGGRGGMIKTPIDLQDLRRKLCAKVKAARSHNPWGEANRRAECGKTACSVRRGGGWRRVHGQACEALPEETGRNG